MRSIAEFVMRGRLQAMLVAVPGAGTGIFFWLSAAIIALVTLRKGTGQGGFILFWSLLPAGLLAWKVDPLPLLCIVTAFVVAGVLRELVRWDLALLAGVAASIVAAAVLQFGFQAYLLDYLTLYQTELGKFQASLPSDSELAPELTKALNGITTSQLAGVFAVLTSMFATLAVIVGRYWQSSLYNVGGFGEEFRALRFTPVVTAVLVLLAMFFYSTADYKLWSWLCLLPLVLVGIALVHAVVNSGRGSKSWLVFFYILLILGPMKELLCVVAVADSLLNFRARLPRQP